MTWLKMCPRCQVELFTESETSGQYISCIQCGGNLAYLLLKRRSSLDPAIAQAVKGFSDSSD